MIITFVEPCKQTHLTQILLPLVVVVPPGLIGEDRVNVALCEKAFHFPLSSAQAVGHTNFKFWFNSLCGTGCLGLGGGEGGKFISVPM